MATIAPAGITIFEGCYRWDTNLNGEPPTHSEKAGKIALYFFSVATLGTLPLAIGSVSCCCSSPSNTSSRITPANKTSVTYGAIPLNDIDFESLWVDKSKYGEAKLLLDQLCNEKGEPLDETVKKKIYIQSLMVQESLMNSSQFRSFGNKNVRLLSLMQTLEIYNLEWKSLKGCKITTREKAKLDLFPRISDYEKVFYKENEEIVELEAFLRLEYSKNITKIPYSEDEIQAWANNLREKLYNDFNGQVGQPNSDLGKVFLEAFSAMDLTSEIHPYAQLAEIIEDFNELKNLTFKSNEEFKTFLQESANFPILILKKQLSSMELTNREAKIFLQGLDHISKLTQESDPIENLSLMRNYCEMGILAYYFAIAHAQLPPASSTEHWESNSGYYFTIEHVLKTHLGRV